MSTPSTSGPAATVARLVLSAPPSAASGSTLPVTGRIDVTSDAPRIVTTSAGSRLLITRDGQVVGTATTGTDEAVPLPLRAGASRPAQVLPGSIRLVDGVDGSGLPAGEYTIVGVLAYGGDPLHTAVGGGRAFELVSEPVPITVR